MTVVTVSLAPARLVRQYQTLPAPNTTHVAPACDGLPGSSTDTRFPASLRAATLNGAARAGTGQALGSDA